MLAVTDRVIDAIAAFGNFRKPNESVGIIAKQQVLELPNRSPTPQNGFVIYTGDIKLVLENNQMLMHAGDWENLVLWHTHPGGSIGPSTLDMQNRQPKLLHLVVALTEDGPIPTLY